MHQPYYGMGRILAPKGVMWRKVFGGEEFGQRKKNAQSQ